MGLTKKQRQLKAEKVIWKLMGERFEVGHVVRVDCPGVETLHGRVAKIEFVSNELVHKPWYHLEGIPNVAFLNEDLRMVWK